MNPEPIRNSTGVRRAIAGTVTAGAIALAGLVWLMSGDEPQLPPAGAQTPAPVVEAPRFAFAPVAAASAADAAPRPESPGEVEMCGGAWLKLGSDGLPEKGELANILSRATNEVGARAIATMTASGSPRAQAAAHYLRLGRADFAALTSAGCKTEECQRDRDALRAESEGGRDDLARLAQESNDPQIYAWAYRGCQAITGRVQGACSFITAGQWTYLDPLLADAWMAAAAEARLRKDGAGVEDAMFHVAHAERVDLGFAALAAEILNHVPTDDETLPGLSGLLVQASGIEASRLRGLASTLEHCSEKELVDSNRRETCARIAAVMTDRSTATSARSMGGELGKRLGWPSERLDALQRELDAGQAAVERQSQRAEKDPLSCRTFRFEVDRVRDIARWGEIEASRRLIAATGKTPFELAAETRRRRAEGEAKAAREDAAASGAAGAAASATSVALQ